MPNQDLPDLSQSEVAYAQLHRAIRDGTFLPGERLREVDVARRLSLSRTPVREALRKLESDGIVEHRPRIGAVIRKLSQPELVELYEMRFVLERTAAEMAAKHASAAEIDALEVLNAQIAAVQNDAQAASALNQKFHQFIYLASRNRFLLDSARGLNNALMLLGPTTLADAARIKTVVQQHQDIIAALQSADPAAAGQAAERHLQASLRHRLKVLQG